MNNGSDGYGNWVGSDPLHSSILPLLRALGFYEIVILGFIQLDWYLITTLVERWKPKTLTFYMSTGKCTVTLQDVEPIWHGCIDSYARHQIKVFEKLLNH